MPPETLTMKGVFELIILDILVFDQDPTSFSALSPLREWSYTLLVWKSIKLVLHDILKSRFSYLILD